MHFTKLNCVALGLILVTTIFTASAVVASQTSCPEHFAGGEAPDFINHQLEFKTRELCYSGYASKHSGVARTSLYSAEHLTRSRVKQAKGMKRDSKFFPDLNIPASERAELYHYARSGYDRGHIAPSGDMPDALSQQECFSLANMMPQNPDNNRGIWSDIESTVRKLAVDRNEIYVVTGPIFDGKAIQRIGGAVMVPTRIFKAIYDPARQEAGAYLVDNAAGVEPKQVSIAELEEITGLSIFPTIPIEVKTHSMRLPAPTKSWLC